MSHNHPPTSPRPGSLLALMAADGTDLTATSVAKALAKRMGGGKSPADKAAAKQASTVVQKQPAPPRVHSPTYWEPIEVVMWSAAWHCCNCGASENGTPSIMLRERHRRSDFYDRFIYRMVAISSPLQYAHLSRTVEVAEPSRIRSCPHCFDATLQSRQQLLPGIEPEPVVEYIKPPIEKLFDNYAAMRAAASSGIVSKGNSL